MSNDNYRPELWDRARSAFESAVQRDIFDVPPQQIDQAVSMARLRVRTQNIEAKAETHYERRKGKAVERVFKKLMRDNPRGSASALAGGPKPPIGAPTKDQLHRQSMRHRAQKIVQINQLKRLDNIDRAQKRMTRQIKHSFERAHSHSRPLKR